MCFGSNNLDYENPTKKFPAMKVIILSNLNRHRDVAKILGLENYGNRKYIKFEYGGIKIFSSLFKIVHLLNYVFCVCVFI